ncbi:MAG: RidA family protein [Chitinophagales bacterium]|nr:RidA family protein [Hyphomicrobiales bacterium]
MRKLISSGSSFEAEIGYSRGVAVDDWVFMSGTTGFNYATMTISDNVVEQAEQCFLNIQKALQKARCDLADVVRTVYIFADADDFKPCWPVFKKYMGDIRPANTTFVATLVDPRMKIEIEVTAKRRAT